MHQRDAAAEPHGPARRDEIFAAPRPQIVDAQVDGADVRETPRRRLFGFLLGILLGSLGERSQRDGEAADHVQRRRDHPAVQDLADRIADQFGPHIEPQPRRFGIERIDLEAEHAIERNHLLEGAPDLRLEALSFSPAGHIEIPDRRPLGLPYPDRG